MEGPMSAFLLGSVLDALTGVGCAMLLGLTMLLNRARPTQ
jgi:hypothetical protein